jgi:hypothetical protein
MGTQFPMNLSLVECSIQGNGERLPKPSVFSVLTPFLDRNLMTLWFFDDPSMRQIEKGRNSNANRD